MIFANPAWLFGLLAFPLFAAIEVWLTRRDRDRFARFVARPLWGRVVRSPNKRWRWIRLTFLLLGAGGLLIALARPQWGIVREKVEREGVDVVLVLDTSGSMATPDVPPSRFFIARQALLQLITRLEGNRFALLAVEGEAYALVPLTLDADALGLFLETLEPGVVPAPGTSLGVGIAQGLRAFVDPERQNKVLVLVSDGEDLEGEIDQAIQQAKAAGVIIHAVAVGTEAGQPVPEYDSEGGLKGFKRDPSGEVVVSRLNLANLDRIARATGGSAFRITPSDTSLSGLASKIESMAQKSLAREFLYRRKEHFQIPLAMALLSLAAGMLLPIPRRLIPSRTRTTGAVGISLAALTLASPVRAQNPSANPTPKATLDPGQSRGTVVDELLLRPRRRTERGRREFAHGNHPQALSAFEGAAGARPADPSVRFNLADGLYKNGRFDEAATLYRSLGSSPDPAFAAAAQFNLGNTLYQKRDFRGAVQAYRDALRLTADDEATRRNLELALRALKEQNEQKKRQPQPSPSDGKPQQKQEPGKNPPQPSPSPDRSKPMTPEERADQRFRDETGMPKQRAMQLLDALQQNEKAEQKRLLALKRARKKKGKEW